MDNNEGVLYIGYPIDICIYVIYLFSVLPRKVANYPYLVITR